MSSIPSTTTPSPRPEMSQRSKDPAGKQTTDITFPISAYILADNSTHLSKSRNRESGGVSKQNTHNPTTRQASAERQSSHSSTNSSRRWSKDSEKGRDSLILGRPLSDVAVAPPPRTLKRSAQPTALQPSFVISPAGSAGPASPRSANIHISRDLSRLAHDEKGVSPVSPRSHRSRLDSVSSMLESQQCRCRDNEAGELYLENKAMSLLIYLSLPAVFVSFVILAWTFLAMVITLLFSPFRLCTSGSLCIRESLISFLDPALRLQLALIHSKKARKASTTCHRHSHHSHHSHHSQQQQQSQHRQTSPSQSQDTPKPKYNALVLLMVHLLSPVVSVGVAVGAWTAAVFWFYAAILGDPAGNDKPQGYNDGKASVLGVRAWWETWLTRPMKR